MGPFLAPVLIIIIKLLDIYMWVVIISVVVSWLLAFGVITMANHLVRMAVDLLRRLTDPVLRPMRRILPYIGGVDLSPLILILIIWLVQAELEALLGYVYRI